MKTEQDIKSKASVKLPPNFISWGYNKIITEFNIVFQYQIV